MNLETSLKITRLLSLTSSEMVLLFVKLAIAIG